MKNEVYDFGALIYPVSLDNFFKTYWEQKPLHLQHRGEKYYEGVLSNHDLENIISSGDLRYPAIKLAKNGTYFPSDAYTNNLKSGEDFFSGVPDINKIIAEYRSGTTVALPALHRTWGPLKELCSTLETYFDHAVHANAYITPGNTVGFTPHYDTHEVFVLQIAGKKRWHVYEPPILLPHRTQQFTPQGYTLPAPLLEIDLNAGDLLYLPRGYVHWAKTSDSYSAHVTIGITVYTWVELATELLKSCKDTMRFRRALPPGFARQPELKQALKKGLTDLVEELRKNNDYDRLLDTFVDAVTGLQLVRGMRSENANGRDTFHADVIVIGLRTTLKSLYPSNYRLTQEDGVVILEFDGRQLKLPGQLQSTITAMCERTSFQPIELPGHQNEDAKLSLVRYLYAEGFLNLAS